MTSPTAVVVGAGPAGLIAAETLAAHGVAVTVVEHMATAGRKFLIAGRGGLNMTHSEPLADLLGRYRPPAAPLVAAISAFGPAELIAWAHDLGETTFVGSSGRVFPVALRATPLLRRWLARLHGSGVGFRFHTKFTGWTTTGAVAVESPAGTGELAADVTILALGGASWPRTGSDAGWVEVLAASGVDVAAMRPANSGFGVGILRAGGDDGGGSGRGGGTAGDGWSAHFRERFAWKPLKNVRLGFGAFTVRGELMITETGVEGGAIYAIGAAVRDEILHAGSAEVVVDLHPDVSDAAWERRLAAGRSGDSSATRLRRAGLSPVAIAVLRETGTPDEAAKHVRLRLTSVAPIERAISTAGGVSWADVDDSLMLRSLPGVFVAGEMLDWEAPTGGYLLQACFSTGVAAANGALAFLARNTNPPSIRS